MKVKLKMTNARALEPACVQYYNTSERPEWSLEENIMEKWVPLDNWGVLILDEVSTAVRRFVRTLCDVGRQRGLSLKNTDPVSTTRTITVSCRAWSAGEAVGCSAGHSGMTRRAAMPMLHWANSDDLDSSPATRSNQYEY